MQGSYFRLSDRLDTLKMIANEKIYYICYLYSDFIAFKTGRFCRIKARAFPLSAAKGANFHLTSQAQPILH